MAADPLSSSTSRINQLKLELKTWEHTFAKTHSGQKPSNADIKSDPTIAAKYKEYYKLLKPSSSSKPSKSSRSHPDDPFAKPASRTRDDDPFAKPTPRNDDPFALSTSKSMPPPVTPTSKRRSSPPPRTPGAGGDETPSRSTGKLPWEQQLYDSPISAQKRLFGNRTSRDAVGPTPQKTGVVLGIFDSFLDSPSSTPQKTPKRKAGESLEAETPSKRNTGDGRGVSRSPGPGELKTPQKNQATPRKPMFETPAGLRRRVPRGNVDSPPVFRPMMRPLLRGLSSMIEELREMEEHAHDDEEEAMREMEMEAAGMSVVKKPVKKVEAEEKVEETQLTEETKRMVDPDGFDLEPEMPPLPPGAFVEDEEIVEEEVEGETRRVWKKKGLKRQTRRVKMKPVTYKVRQDNDDAGEDEEAPEEVQEESGEESGSDYEDIDDPLEADLAALEKSAKRIKKKQAEDAKAAKAAEEAAKKQKEKENANPRKVNANAQSHQNFRKLNIKNKFSKGKGGGRFGRRR